MFDLFSDPVKVAQQLEIARDHPGIFLKHQLSRSGSQLTLEHHCIANLFHNITPVTAHYKCAVFCQKQSDFGKPSVF